MREAFPQGEHNEAASAAVQGAQIPPQSSRELSNVVHAGLICRHEWCRIERIRGPHGSLWGQGMCRVPARTSWEVTTWSCENEVQVGTETPGCRKCCNYGMLVVTNCIHGLELTHRWSCVLCGSWSWRTLTKPFETQVILPWVPDVRHWASEFAISTTGFKSWSDSTFPCHASMTLRREYLFCVIEYLSM